MLYVLIPVAWLSLIAIFWAVCVVAKRGDSDLQAKSNVDHGEGSPDAELVITEGLPEPAVPDTRRTSSGVR